MTVLLALGDSFTCGQGVGVHLAPEQTWVARLAGRLPAGTVTSVAAPGARLSDVRTRQLPALGALPRVDLVTLMAGLNDVARAGFDARLVRLELLATVDAVTARDLPVLLARLHDPSGPLGLPWPFCRLVRARVALLNAAVDEAAARPGVLLLDLAEVPALRDPGGWAVDRVHPSAAGQDAIAHHAARLLRRQGWLVREASPASLPRAVGRLARLRWCARHGLPYAVSHGTDFVVPALTAWRAPRTPAATPA